MAGRRIAFDSERAQEEYAFCTDPISVIAARYGVSASTFRARAKEEGWVRKVQTVRRPRRSKEEVAAEIIEKARAHLGDSIVARLTRAIERKLQEIEKRMEQPDDGRRALDVERDLRALGSLTRFMRSS